MNSNVDILNALRASAPQSYQDNVPVATENNLTFFANPASFDSDLYNIFLNEMFNKIVVQRVFKPLTFNSPFDRFYRDTILLGETEEIIVTDLSKSYNYGDINSPFISQKPNVNVQHFNIVYKKLFTRAVNESLMRQAFTQEGALGSVIADIMAGMELERQTFLFNAVPAYLLNAPITAMINDISDESSAKDFYRVLMDYAKKMRYPSAQYNSGHVVANTNKGNLYLIINSKYESLIDVNVFASLFNSSAISKDQYFADIISFPFPPVYENSPAILCDRDAFIIVNALLRAGSEYNPTTLTTNFYLHNWLKMTINNYMNCVRFVINELPTPIYRTSYSLDDALKNGYPTIDYKYIEETVFTELHLTLDNPNGMFNTPAKSISCLYTIDGTNPTYTRSGTTITPSGTTQLATSNTDAGDTFLTFSIEDGYSELVNKTLKVIYVIADGSLKDSTYLNLILRPVKELKVN